MKILGVNKFTSRSSRSYCLLLACGLIFWAMTGILEARDGESPGKFPSKPLKIWIPGNAGGSNDRETRLLITSLGKTLDTSISIQYVPGAGGVICYNKFYKEKPDGYNLLSYNLQSPLIFELTRSTDYITRDYSTVGAWNVKNQGLFVHPDNWKTIPEFLSEAKKRTISVAGTGGVSVLNLHILSTALGVKFSLVPYASAGEGMTAVAGKHVDALLTYTAVPKPMVTGGKLRALAVLSSRPDPILPQAPILKELGQDDVAVMTTYGILAAPPHTPKEIVAILENAIRKATEDPEFNKLAENAGIVVDFQSSSEVNKSILKQYELLNKYKSFIK